MSKSCREASALDSEFVRDSEPGSSSGCPSNNKQMRFGNISGRFLKLSEIARSLASVEYKPEALKAKARKSSERTRDRVSSLTDFICL